MANTDSRRTQRGRVLALLIQAGGSWVSAPELAKVGGLQFQTRVYELRHKLGLHVENRVERRNGQKHSWYRLGLGAPATTPEQAARSTHNQGKLDLKLEPTYTDPEEGWRR